MESRSQVVFPSNQELLPEKRFLYFANLAKAAGALSTRTAHTAVQLRLSLNARQVMTQMAKWLMIGSDPLAARVAALKPHIHVFGHTHFAWNMALHGECMGLFACRSFGQ
jgi:hypothetical protein